MSNLSLSDEELYSWSIFLAKKRFFFFFCNVVWGVEDDGDFETGRFVFCLFSFDELLLVFFGMGDN